MHHFVQCLVKASLALLTALSLFVDDARGLAQSSLFEVSFVLLGRIDQMQPGWMGSFVQSQFSGLLRDVLLGLGQVLMPLMCFLGRV